MKTRYFAMVIGIVYLLVGVMGFVPAFRTMDASHTMPNLAVNATNGFLVGLFPINVLHNIVHLLVGVLGVGMASKFATAQAFSRGLAIFYGLLAVMGLIPVLNTTFGLIPIFGADVLLHAVSALVAAYFGFVAKDNADSFVLSQG